MSEMVVIECDYGDGECLERFEGFNLRATDRERQDYLRQEKGWLVQDGKHYCPLHKTEIEKGGPK